MANCHDLFTAFDDIIKLPSSKKESLRKSKEALKEKIRKWFVENKTDYKVFFKSQGSYSMHTIILPNGGEYDIDYGIYIIGKKEDRPTPQTAHNWVLSAVNGHTNITIDKNTCVRVVYADDKKHIDLPVYFKSNEDLSNYDEIPSLANKATGWIDSDPYKFIQWFKEKAKGTPQLKRMVRYLKAWSDNKSNGVKMPPGFILTILACINYSPSDRDDQAFLDTLKSMRSSLDAQYGGYYACYRPTPKTDEELLQKYNKDYFLKNLSDLIESGEQAIHAERKKDSCKKWQKHLGDRFPCGTIKDDETYDNIKRYAAPDVIYSNAKSAENC